MRVFVFVLVMSCDVCVGGWVYVCLCVCIIPADSCICTDVLPAFLFSGAFFFHSDVCVGVHTYKKETCKDTKKKKLRYCLA